MGAAARPRQNRDVYQRYVLPDATPGHYILVGRVIVVALLIVGYLLTVNTFELLVVLIALSGIGAGMVTLYVTLVVIPHPLTLHGRIWSVLINFIVTIEVSRFTRPPTAATVWRIHGELERFVYGDTEELRRQS